MKILFYINALGGGGAERAISNTASYFADHGWDTILLTSFRLEHEYFYSDRICRMSIEDEEIIQSCIKRNISRIKAIRQICKTEGIDVVVSFMGEPNIRTLIATLGLKTKCVVSIRSDPSLEYEGIIRGLIGQYLLSCADGAVFQTEDARMWFSEKLQKKSAIIYNVVDDSFYNTEYRGGSVIVSCGRLVPTKNPMLLVRAFKKVLNAFPEAQLQIYGETEVDVGLSELIEGLDLRGAVWLMGRTEDVPSVLSKASIFVLPSDYEGMPNALMEAMAVGVPCISTDCPCGGPRELFGNDLVDMLVPVRDEDALVDKMIELLSDDKKRQEIGRKMRKRAEEFRADKIGREWMEYVESVCQPR